MGTGPYPDATSATPQPPVPDWKTLLESDPLYQQGLADLLANSQSDRSNTLAGLRSSLVRFGGGGLQGLQLPQGWADALDPATLGAAAAGDTAGTSLHSQLQKAHAGRNLAIQDVLAAKGILSSGQTGYELGEERQRHTIAHNDAVNALLDFLGGLTSGFATREGERNYSKANLGNTTLQRLYEMGVEPPAPPPLDPAGKPKLSKRRRRGSGATGHSEE